MRTPPQTSVDVQQRPRFQFSIRSILAIAAFVGMACAITIQNLRLAEARASLSRYESSLIPTSLQPSQFRIITRVALDTDHVKVVNYRIESLGEHFANIQSGGDGNGAGADYDAQTGLYFSEVTILLDHTKSTNSLKVMPKVGGAQGYSIQNVAEDFSLEDAVTFHDEDHVHERDESIELFRLDGRPYSLTLTP